MGFAHFTAARIVAGKIIPVVLNQLPGAPVVGLEHIGDGNATFVADQIAKAGTDEALHPGAILASAAAVRARRADTRGKADDEREQREQIARFRELVLRHGVRQLVDVKHSDGAKATDADIPEFVTSLPDDVVVDLALICFNKEHWRERPEADVATVAGK